MPGPSTGKSSKHNTGSTGQKQTSLNASTLILSGVKEAAALAPFQELKRAATVTLEILQSVHVWARKNAVKDNREAFERLGDDSGGLIVVIWRSYKKAQVPDEWLSMEMRDILQDLTHTLENISSFIQGQLSRSKAIRLIFSKADAGKISEYREHLNYAMQRFELQSHMNINTVLMRLMRISGQILHQNGEQEDVKRTLEITAREARDREEAERIHEEELKAAKQISALEQLKQAEIDQQAEDERRQSDKLQKLEKETKARQSELQRLRAAASALELANRLKKEQEAEIAALKRKIAGGDESTTVQTQSSKQKSSRQQATVEDEEEEWTGDVMIEEATSEEEEEVRRPVRKSSRVKVNPSRPPKRRPVVDDSTDDDAENLHTSRRSKIKTAHRKVSNASFRAEETTEDESTDEYTTDEEEAYVPSHPKVNCGLQSSSASLLRDLDGMMAQFEGFTPLGLGNPHGSRPNSRPSSRPSSRQSSSRPSSRPSSPMFFPMHGSPLGPYGYMPGTVVNSGIGNITNSIISNVGNDNSVRTVYH